MTNQAFDFLWNGFGNKELTDGKTSSCSAEGGKKGSLVEKTRHAEWRKQDNRYYNRKPNNEKHLKRSQTKTVSPEVKFRN